jgi:hypothetical protein
MADTESSFFATMQNQRRHVDARQDGPHIDFPRDFQDRGGGCGAGRLPHVASEFASILFALG